MGENSKPKSNTEIIVGLLGCLGLIVAAIIGLGLPFADRLADRVFATPAPGTVVGGEATEQSKEALNCSFHKEIEQKAIIQQWFTFPAGSNNRIGAKIRTTDEVVVPQGWIVQRGNANEYGPVVVHNGEIVSIYSPEPCRPLK